MLNYLLYLGILVILFLSYFYRKPKQIIINNNEDYVYSPAYGRIMDIKEREDNIYIAIFLSPFDIHYQFIPINGKILEVKYDANGKFNLAYDLNKSRDNEKTIITLKNKHGIFTIYQIAGFLVRRITPMILKNELVKTGMTLGLIHFGSRVDIIIPKKNFKLLVKKGMYMNGTNTILGRYI